MFIDTLINSIIASFVFYDTKRIIHCPYCFMTNRQEKDEWDYNDIAKLFIEGGTSIMCSHNVPIHISDIAPDIGIKCIPVIDLEIMDKEKIGEGGFGVVYKVSTYIPPSNNLIDVALKVLKIEEGDEIFHVFNREVMIMRFGGFVLLTIVN